MKADLFQAVYQRDREAMVRLADRSHRREIEPEDIVQQATLELWEQNVRGGVASEMHLSALFHQRVESRVIDEERRLKRISWESLSVDAGNQTCEEGSVLHPNLTIDERAMLCIRHDVEQGLAQIPTNHRRIVAAYYVNGFTQQEIASSHNISRDQVGRRIRQWQKFLCRHLAAYRPCRKNKLHSRGRTNRRAHTVSILDAKTDTKGGVTIDR